MYNMDLIKQLWYDNLNQANSFHQHLLGTCSMIFILVRVSIAMKRHPDHSNSYQENDLIGAVLQFQRFSPLL